MAPAPIRTHQEMRRVISEIRVNKYRNEETGKLFSLPVHMMERKLLDAVVDHMKSRGQMFRAPYPYFYDRIDNSLTRLDGSPPPKLFKKMLMEMDLLQTQKLFQLVATNVANVGDLSELRPLHRLAFMNETTAYLNMGNNQMLRITADHIDQVNMGTDDVFLLADDVGAWPSLKEMQPYIDEYRPIVGRACLKLIPALPLTQFITGRWSHNAALAAEQAHHLFISRFIFIAAASRYPKMWPLTLLTGDQDSGKSTPPELIMSLLCGEEMTANSLPGESDDLLASATNRSYLIYDNVDGANLHSDKSGPMCDTICHLASGANTDLRVLYTTNDVATFKVQNHTTFTCRVNPFPFTRTDILRRTIHLEMQDADPDNKREKTLIINEMLAHRTKILAEVVLRVQQTLIAHMENGKKEYRTISGMTDFEAFTLKCAEHEGVESTLDTEELWQAYMKGYDRTITETNPVVAVIKIWLGKRGNAGRKVHSEILYTEARDIHQMLRQNFKYETKESFGIYLRKHKASLMKLNMTKGHDDKGNFYIFNPPAEEVERCIELVDELRKLAETQEKDRWVQNYIRDIHQMDNTEDL